MGVYAIFNVPGVPWTRRSPTALAAFLLGAMGVKSDRVEMPAEPGIPVDWNGDDPAVALADLLEAYGCEMTWQNGVVSIRTVL